MRVVLRYRVTIAFAVVLAAVGAGFWKLTSVANQANEAAAESRRVAIALDRRVDENARTIRDLCDRGYILDDLVLAAIELVKQPPNPPGDLTFLSLFRADHASILDSLTREDSLCNSR